jgi:hypothetical protein
MLGREAMVTQETCLRRENASTSGTTSEKMKAVSAQSRDRGLTELACEATPE